MKQPGQPLGFGIGVDTGLQPEPEAGQLRDPSSSSTTGSSSETMQIRVSRPSRAERTTTSCSECRRRKQRCNQGQPCNNCARRFPQPVCEYRPSSKRYAASGISNQPTFTVTLPDSIRGPDYSGIRGIGQPLLPVLQHPYHGPSATTPWPGEVVRWSGVDLFTQYPGGGTSAAAAAAAIAAAAGSGATWGSSGILSAEPSTTADCDDDCRIHSEAVHDAFRLLKARRMIPNRFIGDWNPNANMDDFFAWLRVMTWTSPEEGGGGGGAGRGSNSNSNLHQINSATDNVAHLPVQPTRLNAELMAIYVKLISRFKACVDGNPDSSSPYIRFYVPYCIQTPLLAQVAIYTSACFLNETGHLDKMVAMSHKGAAIRMLNDHLRRSRLATGDEAVTAVIQLIMDEWYWGETGDLRAHLRGLREMIRLRGGLQQLGMNGMIGKLALASDSAIALSFEIPPFLRDDEDGLEFRETQRQQSRAPFRVAHNTPLVAPLPSFADCAEATKMHPATASILDDMRFLITTVLNLPARPSATELRKVRTTSAWIHERMLRLPAEAPAARRETAVGVEEEKGKGKGKEKGQEGEASRGNLNLEVPRAGRAASSSSSRASSAAGEERRRPRDRLTPTPTPSPSGTAAEGSRPAAHSGTASRRPSAQSLRQDDAEPTSRRVSAEPSPSRPSSHRESSPSPSPSPSPTPPDTLYQAVRLTALIYSRAITTRRPFSAVVSPAEFLALWTTTWRVSLTAWRGLVGVFMWITLAIVASARDTPHDRFVKSMLSICCVQMSLEAWDVARRALGAALRLGAWLRGGEGGDEGEEREGGEGAVGAREDGPVRPTAKEEEEVAVGGVTGRDDRGGGQDVVDFSAAEATPFSGGGRTIREKGSALPRWDA